MSNENKRESRGWRVVASSPTVLTGLTRFGDLLIILIVAWLSYAIRHDSNLLPSNYVVAIAVGMFLAANAFQLAGLYRFDSLDRIGHQAGRLAVGWAAVSVGLLAVSFFSKTSADFSRIWVGTWLVFSFFGLAMFRSFLVWRVHSWRQAGLLLRKVVIVGAGQQAERLIRHIKQGGNDLGVHIEAVFTLNPGAGRKEVLGVPVQGSIDDLLIFIRTNEVQEIMVALPWDREEQIASVLSQLREAPMDVSLAPEPLGFRLMERRVRHLGDLPMTMVQEPPLSGWNYIIKSLEDRVLSALIILAISPILLLLTILIRLDSPGPAIFRQQRYGFNNNVFTVFKFRSMRDDIGDVRGGAQATRGDPRITRIGAFIRKTSLDELPQLFNVLLGDMSLVGPRPHAVAHNEEYAGKVDQYLSRHKVKPGITGWAQIHGFRGETDTDEKMEMRVQYDLYYIDNWSLWLDLRIIIRTLVVGFVNENAY